MYEPPRSTSRDPHGDVSRDRDATSAEAALFHGYRTLGLEERPCVCGGIVRDNPLAPGAGVAAHRYTSRHKAWASIQDFVDDLPGDA